MTRLGVVRAPFFTPGDTANGAGVTAGFDHIRDFLNSHVKENDF